MNFTVYHARRPNFGIDGHQPFDHNHFKAVGVVEAGSPDSDYRLTNHEDKPWWDNLEVAKHVGTPRSTSVGDVLVGSDGKAYRCEVDGWSMASGNSPTE